ncbi:MAG: Fic family protein [Bacteroidota bacterium]
MYYNWQLPDWPHFSYDLTDIEDDLFSFAEETGHISGLLKAMPSNMQLDAIIQIMVAEAMKTSEIEGEYFSRKDVTSSIRNHLGLNQKKEIIKNKKAAGIGQLMVEVRKSFADSLTEQHLFVWHKMLMKENSKINVGAWRKHTEPMQVVSGAIGKEQIHFEAPPSRLVKQEMRKFIKWYNDTAPGGSKEIKKAPVRAAIAHLYFESIYPFEDGNGRIGRAIAEKALSQTVGRPLLISLSQTIETNKKAYYSALQKAQSGIEITDWIKYFVQTTLIAQKHTKETIAFILKKAAFIDQFKEQLNPRQFKIVSKMTEQPNSFKDGMTAKKYIAITKSSKATATRDLQELLELGAIRVEGGGRSTRYYLNTINK